MYRIEPTDFGFRLTFGGILSVREIRKWYDEFAQAVEQCDGAFLVFVDMRTLIPLRPEAQEHMVNGQRLAREKGMLRSVVILSNPATTTQFRRLGGESGINRFERYVDASIESDWEQIGMDWLLKQIDPVSRRPVTTNA